MNIQFRPTIASLVTGTATGTVVATADGSRVFELAPTSPLAIRNDPHLVALASIVALVLLGGVLVIRNRLEGRDSLATSQETRINEFKTDRERVHELVKENGGRMKQSKIVDSVDWSKAKVSRLLADLEDDGQITKLRLGRENLVCLPGNEPTASKSPEHPNNE
ncbi:helix-turn-helix transcriptional regulator [Natrarchaeobius oligotrophus]|uniref:DUF7343 domain-containing protein n=1 Tax=Natrarchaeobius chitinivorans TaxID=1679083 RepID=A0A3N6MVC3_NATCH|nr:hypothetical protein [Natrarchaeobius chitinivorans]RQH00272.1 hypothetical protein EA472_10410 [Natrarchaeobius chitinivorans]